MTHDSLARHNVYVFEKFLYFLIQYDQILIAVSASVVVIAVAFWIFFDVFVNKDSESVSAEADYARIEASIEKLLEKADLMKSEPSGAQGAGAAVSSEEVLALQKELEEKKTEVETLREKASQPHEDNTPELLSKIKNLEARLAEYEIIEDDIADLSHYKEENEKLKRQLASLGSEPEVAPSEESEAPVEESPLVNDFSKAVEEMESQVVKPAEAAPEAALEDPTPASDDVFAEYEEKTNGEADPLAALGDIDTNRMLEELQGLEAEAASAEVLAETPDVEKMAEEAQQLEEKEEP